MRTRSRKLTALFFLVVFSVETLVPGAAYALTSGPDQPEMKQFEPAGATDMVDLFTGDLKYNVPLGDIDGYPLNLAYQSGGGMEDEASWVGAGWSLNPGALTRQMRGLPDDFNGVDKVTKEYDRKEFRKVGGNVVLKPELFGWELGGPSFKVGVYRDNYYGIGADVGASISQSLSLLKSVPMTAGLNVSTDSRNGVSISPSLGLSWARDGMSENPRMSLTGSFTYNTRAALKEVALSGNFSIVMKNLNRYKINLSAAQYFGQSYTPSIPHNTTNSGFTFNFDTGPALWGTYFGIGGSGYYYWEKLKDRFTSVPAYGYMHYLIGRKNTDALLDFNREKDGVLLPGAKAIPIPVATPDLWTATNQLGSQAFRPYFGGNYIVFDKAHSNKTNNLQLGVTLGVGTDALTGGRVEYTSGDATSNKWTINNDWLQVGEATFDKAITPTDEAVYFKQSGEHTRSDNEYISKIGDEEAGQVAFKNTVVNGRPGLDKVFKTRVKNNAISSPLRKTDRERRRASISYLNAGEARYYGLEKTINTEPRITSSRKSHHISEVTVTDGNGGRMVYGIPVYNHAQTEVSFSAAAVTGEPTLTRTRRNGIIYYQAPNGKVKYDHGRDKMFSKETVPAFATSFLLTGVLSPDYIDLKGDGISDDDLGTAIKFSYIKRHNNYQWRAPYATQSANYNEGFISDPKDDKGSYVFGNKEIWYLDKMEGKNMIAVFETSEREDGLGVNGEQGGQNKTVKLRKLDKIKLYSKADYASLSTAVPVKTIHFEYDYSLYPNLPNNSGDAVEVTNPANPSGPKINLNAAKGKLTLKKVYFTFGNNKRGVSNPFEFAYDMRMIRDMAGLPYFNGSPTGADQTDVKELNEEYTERQQDRWGSYKHSRYNRLVGQGASRLDKMSNSEFPYTLQENDRTDFNERDLVNRFVSKWQLNSITTPAGSVISVEYESDDYAFVQNRKAMQMCFVKSVDNGPVKSNGLIGAGGIKVQLPFPVTSKNEFRDKYLRGADGQYLDKIFYKVYADLTNEGHYEYVQGYASLTDYSIDSDGDVFIQLGKVAGKNPISKAAWQMMRSDLPQYAYDNYDNSDESSLSGNTKAAIKSIIAAFVNFRELFLSFDDIASGKDFANTISLEKSMVRLYCPTGKKLGGGSRVRKVIINDNWHEMTDNVSKSASSGQLYEYFTKKEDGSAMSSGVASYEPFVGNEENPFREPEPFIEKVNWGLDRQHYIERPYCESYFPSPIVGYSKVTVTSLGDDYILGSSTAELHAGYMEHEFYTARDFPTLVDNMPLERKEYENNLIMKLFSCTYLKRVVASQGFKVELNDMHGKPRSVKAFDKTKGLVSGSETIFNVVNEDAETKQLENRVQVLTKEGVIEDETLIGTDVDFVTDMRESINESVGSSIGAYAGVSWGFWFPFPYGSFTADASISKQSYNSTSAVKVIHKYGIPRKVITYKNGSALTAENLVWDAETGHVVLTSSQNEFKDKHYSFTYPAYRAEQAMGSAYTNIGAVFTNFTTSVSGEITTYKNYLHAGDELVSLDTDRKGWVITQPVSGGEVYRLVDAAGEFIQATGRYMVLRSGKRNLVGASVGAIVSMRDPRVKFADKKYNLVLDVDKRILDAKAVSFTDQWQVPVSQEYIDYGSCEDGSCTCSCLKGFFDYLIATNKLFLQSSDNTTVGQLVTAATTAGYTVGSCPAITKNSDKLFYAVTTEQTASIYTARLGDCIVSIRSDNGTPISFNNLKSQACVDGKKVNYVINSKTFSNTYYTSCTQTKNLLTNAVTMSSPVISTGSIANNGFHSYLRATAFKIAGLSDIPSNAHIDVANFYIYAALEGFDPPTINYPHEPYTTPQGISPYNFAYATGWNDCSAFAGSWAGSNQPVTVHAYSNSDAIVDFRSLVFEISHGITNSGFYFRTETTTTPGLTERKFATYASENYPNAAKRPRLEVTYTVPVTPQSATLTVDVCDKCADPVEKVINPYVRGLRGNWRPVYSMVYTVDREQKAGLPYQQQGTNIRQSGYYKTFVPYWTFNGGNLQKKFQINNPYDAYDPAERWIWASRPVYYDQKGNEVESMDALKRFSSALFGYRESVATAIGANARRNEIAYDGFEDYKFKLHNGQPDNCPLQRSLDWKLVDQNGSWCGPGGCISTEQSHSGKYSLKLSGTATISKPAGSLTPNFDFLGYDAAGHYKLLDNMPAQGFRPVSGKRYMLSCWVKDNNANDNKINGLTVYINGQNRNVQNIVVPVVEEWKRLELEFVAGTTFDLQLSGSNIYVDDIRILPFDGQLVSYVYDDVTMRLMAQMDENNFATFYEYDDEGTPIRIKKETDRGIMTIKENRQFYRKRN